MTHEISLRPIEAKDRAHIRELLLQRWGSLLLATRGKLVDASTLEGFLVETAAEEISGLITLQIEGDECEVVSLDSFNEGAGIGTALLQHTARFAGARGCRRLWLITTNDNLHALRLYQKRGMHIAALYPDAITHARQRLKPQIPLIGGHGIPIRDEIELALRPAGDGSAMMCAN